MCEQDALPWAVPIRITFLLTDAIGSSNKSTHPQTWRRWRADHGQTGCYSGREVRLTGNLGPGHKAPPVCVFVLVQPEMERGRSPLVSIPPFGRGFSRHQGLPIRCGFLEERGSEAAALRSSSR